MTKILHMNVQRIFIISKIGQPKCPSADGCVNKMLCPYNGKLCLVAQSCPTLCKPWTIARQAPLSMKILQARILEWVAMPSSRECFQLRDRA